jgi:hypothetical protein
VADTLTEAPAEGSRDRNQIVAAIILGIAATLTAVAAYNAALTDGDALQGYTNSTRSLNDANAFYAQGNTRATSDQALFVEYANANFDGDSERAQYLLTLMRPELAQAVAWWEATEEAVTPFDDLEGNPYTIAEFDQARELEELAQAQFDDAVGKDEQGDEFELATVFFALSLFFGGIATLFAKRAVATGLLAVSVLTLALGSVILGLAF